MPRPLSPEREKEFQELLGFVEFCFEALQRKDYRGPGMKSEAERIAIEFGRSKALEGLRMAANDTIEMACDYPPDAVKTLDNALRDAGLLTLSEVRRRYASAYKRVLRRGFIKTDTEYYLVHGIIVDMGNEIADDERAQLEVMTTRYAEQALQNKA